MGLDARAHGIKVPHAALGPRDRGKPSAMRISTIGLDLAKNVFQVHGVDAEGRVVVQRRVRRSQVVNFFAQLSRCLDLVRTLVHGGVLAWRVQPGARDGRQRQPQAEQQQRGRGSTRPPPALWPCLRAMRGPSPRTALTGRSGGMTGDLVSGRGQPRPAPQGALCRCRLMTA